MPPLVLLLDDAKEPAKLFEGGVEPAMVVENDVDASPRLRVRGGDPPDPAFRLRSVSIHRGPHGRDRPLDIGERVLFEKDEAVAPTLEPIDQLTERLGNGGNIHDGTWKGHRRAAGVFGKAVAEGQPEEQWSPEVSDPRASGECSRPSFVRPMNGLYLRPVVEQAISLNERTTVRSGRSERTDPTVRESAITSNPGVVPRTRGGVVRYVL